MMDIMDKPPESRPQSDPPTPPPEPSKPAPPPSEAPPLEPLSTPPSPPIPTVRAEKVIAASDAANNTQPSIDSSVPTNEAKSPTHAPTAAAGAAPQSVISSEAPVTTVDSPPFPESIPEAKSVVEAEASPKPKAEPNSESKSPPSSSVKEETTVDDSTSSKIGPSPDKGELPSRPASTTLKSQYESPHSSEIVASSTPQLQSEPASAENQEQLKHEAQLQHVPPTWKSNPQVNDGPASPGPPPSGFSQPPLNTGPIPRNLPKNAKSRPENSRVFVGNLASEFTNVQEMIRIFCKYGELIEEPVLRRSFGFIQYASPESAARAVQAEHRRIIGEIPIDLSIADNREVKRGTHVVNNTPFPHGPKGKFPVPSVRGPRPRDPAPMPPGPSPPARKRRRSLSPGAPPRRIGVVNPPTFHRARPEPRTGHHLRILCMSPTARVYAKQCEAMFRNEVGLGVEIMQIIASGLGEALAKAMRDSIPYVMVVASKDVEDGTCTIRTLERTGYEKAGRGNGIIPLREAIEVCLIDRGMPVRRGQAPHPLAHLQQFPPLQHVPMPQAGWGQPGPMSASARQGAAGRKPGWMTGTRVSSHPQQQHLLRQGLPPHGAVPPHIPGPPPSHQPYPAPHEQQLPPHQMGHLPGRSDTRGQFDRSAPYGGGSQSTPEYGAPPGQGGWMPSGQQPPMHGYGQHPVPHQPDYSRGGAYPGPAQGAMSGRSGLVLSSRDEYDPTTVMPGGGGSQNGQMNAWNMGSQDSSYHRHGGQYPVGRPGPPGQQGVQPPAYGMGPPQGGFNPSMGAAPYGNLPGSDQSYSQRSAAYAAPSSSGPPGGRYGATGSGPGGAAAYDSSGNWGPGNGSAYDARMPPHGGMPADSRNHSQGYGSVAPPIHRRDGPGYMDQLGAHGAQGSEWGGQRSNGTRNNSSSRPGSNMNTRDAGGGGNMHSYNGGPGVQNGRTGINGSVNTSGGPPPAPDGVDIGKLTNLISAFQQQRTMQGSTAGSMGGGGSRNGSLPTGSATSGRGSGNATSSSLLTVPGVPSRHQSGGHRQQYHGQYGGPPQQQQHGMYQQSAPSQQQRNFYGR